MFIMKEHKNTSKFYLYCDQCLKDKKELKDACWKGEDMLNDMLKNIQKCRPHFEIIKNKPTLVTKPNLHSGLSCKLDKDAFTHELGKLKDIEKRLEDHLNKVVRELKKKGGKKLSRLASLCYSTCLTIDLYLAYTTTKPINSDLFCD